MLAPHEPTWLEWAEVLAVTVLWYVGPALARDALDSYFDRPRPPDPPEEGPGSTRTRSEAARLGGRALRCARAAGRPSAAWGFQALVDPPPTTPDLHQGEAK